MGYPVPNSNLKLTSVSRKPRARWATHPKNRLSPQKTESQTIAILVFSTWLISSPTSPSVRGCWMLVSVSLSLCYPSRNHQGRSFAPFDRVCEFPLLPLADIESKRAGSVLRVIDGRQGDPQVGENKLDPKWEQSYSRGVGPCIVCIGDTPVEEGGSWKVDSRVTFDWFDMCDKIDPVHSLLVYDLSSATLDTEK